MRGRGSYFRAAIEQMAGYVPGEQPKGGGFVKLNTNENPYPPSPRVIEAIHRVAGDGLRRYPDPLADEFRARAADLFGVEPSWILAGNGCDDILTIVTRSFVGAGDVVRFAYPSYLLYETLTELQQGCVERVAYRDGWGVPPELAVPEDRLRLLFFPNPHSPSGTLAGTDAIRRLAQSIDVPLVLDEAYADFAHEHNAGLPAECENVIVTRTLSKSYSLAGIRLGFAIAEPALIEGLRKVKDSYNCDTLSLAAAVAALEDQSWMRANVEKIGETRARLTEALRQMDFDVPDSQANFVWCTHPKRAAQSLFEQLRDRKVLVRYMNFPDWGDGLRISVGTDAEIDRLLEELTTLVTKPKRGSAVSAR